MSKPILSIVVTIEARNGEDVAALLVLLQQLAQAQIEKPKPKKRKPAAKKRTEPALAPARIADEQLETEVRQNTAKKLDAKDEAIQTGKQPPVPADPKALAEKTESLAEVGKKEGVKTVVAELVKAGLSAVLGSGS